MHGIRVKVIGSKASRKAFTVDCQSYESTRPPGVGPEKLKSPIFFDISVDGLSGGKATVRITHDTVTKAHKVNHWNGKRWVDHPEKKVSGKTIRAKFKVRDLNGTPVVIGT